MLKHTLRHAFTLACTFTLISSLAEPQLGNVAWHLTAEQKDDAGLVLFNQTRTAHTEREKPHAFTRTDSCYSDLNIRDIATTLRPMVQTTMGYIALAEVILLPQSDPWAIKNTLALNQLLRENEPLVMQLDQQLRQLFACEENVLRYGIQGHPVYATLQEAAKATPFSSVQAKGADYYLKTGWIPAAAGLAGGGALLASASGNVKNLYDQLPTWLEIVRDYQTTTVKDNEKNELWDMINHAKNRLKEDPEGRFAGASDLELYKMLQQPENAPHPIPVMKAMAAEGWKWATETGTRPAPLWRHIEHDGTETLKKTVSGALLCLLPTGLWLTSVAQAKTIRTNAVRTRSVEKQMHRCLGEIKQVIQVLSTLHTILTALPETPVLPERATFQRYFNPACTDYCSLVQELQSHLQRATFDGEPGSINPDTILYHRLYKGMKLLRKALPHLHELMAAAGMLDARLVPLRLQRSGHPQGIRWTLPDFTYESDAPTLELEGLQQILFKESVENSVRLGGKSDKRILLITGPNGSGKTTLMRSLCQAIIFAQSLGIVPAQKCTLTPFSIIRSSRDIGDNIMQGASRFAAEVRSIQRLKDSAANLQQHEHGFFFVDEPYSGTTSENGARHTQRLIETVAQQMPHIILALASHHELAFKQLPKTTIGHMQVEPDAIQGFVLRYLYLPGVATWWYQDAKLREAFATYFEEKQLHEMQQLEAQA
jgi:hypothetical protein